MLFATLSFVLMASPKACFVTEKEQTAGGQPGHLAIGSMIGLQNDTMLFMWEKYKIKYNKHYAHRSQEDLSRFQVFTANIRAFEEHNKLYAQGVFKHTKGINQFTDWTEDEVLSYSCLPELTELSSQTSSEESDFLKATVYTSPLTSAEAKLIPESIDWRRLGRAFPAKDQGACGSCWAFASTGVLEGQLARVGWFLTLSEQNLMDCIKNGSSCTGGFPYEAYNYVAENGGIDLESAYPYVAHNQTCKYQPETNPTIDVSGYVELPRNEFGIVDEAVIKEVLATVGPVAALIAARDVKTYMQGILYCKPDDHINHAVVIAGYGTEMGADYWIVKNSWGQDFGEGGYFRILRGKNMCRIEEYIDYPLFGEIH